MGQAGMQTLGRTSKGQAGQSAQGPNSLTHAQGQVWERKHNESSPVRKGMVRDPCKVQHASFCSRQPAIHGLVRGSSD